MLDEACRIITGGAQRGRIIQEADQRVRVPLGGDPSQRALARLAGAVQRDDPAYRSEPQPQGSPPCVVPGLGFDPRHQYGLILR